MPKMKTNRAAAKRFKFTGTGKVKLSKANRRHILTKKSRHKKRQMRLPAMAAPGDERRAHILCPYGA